MNGRLMFRSMSITEGTVTSELDMFSSECDGKERHSKHATIYTHLLTN